MILKLPNDVENYILNMVINGINIKNISKVCKNWKKIVMVSDYKKQEKNLYNKTRILMEDKQILLKDDYFDLAIKWEKFNSHKWDKIYNSIDEDPDMKTNLWKIGDYIDVKDKINAWAPAKIIDIDTGQDSFLELYYRRYHVKFLGWSDYFNEWVTSFNIRKLGYHTIIPSNKFDGIKKEKIWSLIKINNEWKMVVIRGIMSPQNDKSNYKLLDTNEGIVRIEKKDIDEKIISTSNTTSFLLTPYRFNPKFRENYL